MIRLASLNQILDPWVYILLRREVVWRVGHTLKKIFCRESKSEKQHLKFRRQESTVVLMNDVNYTCCMFCFHCLCDAPQSRPSSSQYSVYNDYRHNSIYSKSGNPTSKLAMSVIQNIVPPNNIQKSVVDERSLATENLEMTHKASCDDDIVTQQPLVRTRVQLYSNGSSVSEPQLCETLLEADDISSESGFDSVWNSIPKIIQHSEIFKWKCVLPFQL